MGKFKEVCILKRELVKRRMEWGVCGNSVFKGLGQECVGDARETPGKEFGFYSR